MLNQVSCWYVDWTALGAIGSWVGGIGALLAAGVALRIANRDVRQRTEFAKFLLSKDLDRTADLISAFSSMEKHLRKWYEPNDDKRAEVRSAYSAALKRAEDLIGGFEYLVSSDQQFYFRPHSESLPKLVAYVARLHRIGEFVGSLSIQIDADVAADYVREKAQMLADLREPLMKALYRQ